MSTSNKTVIKSSIPSKNIVYIPNLFSLTEANTYFEQLRQHVDWNQETIRLYGQAYEVPRLTAWYGDEDKSYTYSGITLHPVKWITPLLKIKKRIENISACSFNSVLLNRYRNGSDSVSWHADDEPELGPNPLIGSVSFGGTRPFQMKHKFTDERREILLQHGSYLFMKGSTQHHYLHKIPKTKRAVGERINLTFRQII